MTSEECKEKSSFAHPWLNADTTQRRDEDRGEDKELCDTGKPLLADPTYINPKEKYLTFKDREECFKEMMNHYPFGWVRNKEDGTYDLITSITDCVYIGPEEYPFSYMLLNYSFADSTPFGI